MVLLDVFIRLIDRLIDLIRTRRAVRSSKFKAYIFEVRSVCLQLVDIDDPTSDKARLLHQQLKEMQEIALGLPMESIVFGILYSAIVSARIYYWLRIYDGELNTELKTLIETSKHLPLILHRKDFLQKYSSVNK
jgi:hypothetical protein